MNFTDQPAANEPSADTIFPLVEIVEAELPVAIDARFNNSAGDFRPRQLSLGGRLAWIVIGLVTLGVVGLVAFVKPRVESSSAPDASSAELAQLEMQGKMFLALRELGPPANAQPLPSDLDVGPVNQRLCYTILVNEISGPVAAREHFRTTAERIVAAQLTLTDEQTRLRSIIDSLIDDSANSRSENEVINPEDRQLLRKKLGWFGELILVPKEIADQTQRQSILAQATSSMFAIAVSLIGGILAAVVGLIVAIVLIVLLFSGKIHSRFAHQTSRHNLYAETFALWMVVFFGGQIPFGLALQGLGVDNEVSQMMWMPVLFFGSLLTLIWPVVRGIPWTEVRRDIGWKFGNPFVEGGLAIVAYVALLPAIVLSMLLVIVLITMFGQRQSVDSFSRQGGPSHPIQEYIAEGNLAVLGMILVMACVAAPIVEETMFRGVFFRHLRDLSSGWQRGASLGLACLINSFVFAAIHPQGLFGIPMLMTLAIGFSLAREWRGSLLAPMLMHALNNFLITMMAFWVM